MTTIGEAIIEVHGDTSPLDRDIARGTSPSRMGKFGKMAGAGLAAGLTAAAGAAIAGGAFLKSAIGGASDLNETVNKSNTIFGKSANSIMRWSKTSDTALGLSQEQALASAAGFGDMFSQIGFTSKAAADMSKKTVQMAADLGSFNNLETSDVADRMSAAFRGEYDSLQAVIPNINAARVESEALAATGKKTAKELTAQEKAAAVLAIVHKDGARAQGDFAKTSGGLANQQKILGAQWDNLKAKIGTGLLPVATKFFGYLTGTALPALSNMGPLFDQAKTAIEPVIDAVRRVFASFSGGEGIGMLDEVRSTFSSVFASVKEIVRSAVQILTVLWNAMGMHFVGYLKSTFSAMLSIIKGAFNIIAGIFKVVSSLLRGDWKGVWDGIKQILRGAWQVIGGIVKAGWASLKLIFTAAGVVLRGIFSRLWDGVKTLAGNAWSAIKGIVSKGASGVVDFVKGIPGRIIALAGAYLNAGKTVGSKIIGGIMDGLRSAGGFVSDLASSVKSAINGALNLPFTIKGPGPLPDFTIPAFAKGTNNAPGGMALVGEQGPELVNLPRGSKVLTAARTRAMGRTPTAGTGGSVRGALRLVSGTLAADPSVGIYLRDIVVEEVDDSNEFDDTIRRMG